MENGYNALLVAMDSDRDEDLLPPEGYKPAGPITPEGCPVDNAADLSAAERAILIQPPGLASAKELLRIAADPQQQPAAPLGPQSTTASNPPELAAALDLGSGTGLSSAQLSHRIACAAS